MSVRKAGQTQTTYHGWKIEYVDGKYETNKHGIGISMPTLAMAKKEIDWLTALPRSKRK